MPWKKSSVMEERLRFVARLLEGERISDVCRDRTRAEVARLLGDAKDSWCDRPLGEVAPADGVALLDACAEIRSATQSNRLYSYLSGFFNWAADRHMIEHVPIRRGMKGKREHLLPLSRFAGSLLRTPRENRLSDEFVFAMRNIDSGVTAITWFSKPKARLDQLSGVTSWRLHDLRWTVATNLEQMGVERVMIRTILAHHIAGVTEIYTRPKRTEKMRIALENRSTRIQVILNHEETEENALDLGARL